MQYAVNVFSVWQKFVEELNVICNSAVYHEDIYEYLGFYLDLIKLLANRHRWP